MAVLDALPYQQRLRDFLKEEEAALWNWFSSTRSKADYSESVRLELLKYSYRMDREAHAGLYNIADQAANALELPELPLTLYQSQAGGEANACIMFLPGEAHIMFSGKLLEL